MDRDYEAEAKRSGWVDKGTWVERGNTEDTHRSAEEFIKVGEEQLPIAKANLSKLNEKLSITETKLSQNDSQITRLQHMIKGLVEQNKSAEERAYKRALAAAKKERNEALRDQDFDRAEAITEELDDLKDQHHAATKAPAEPEPESPAPDPRGTAWLNRPENEWYQRDMQLQLAADAYCNQMAIRGIDPYAPDSLSGMEDAVKRMYPEKFENGNRNQPAAVSSGGGVAMKKTKNGYSNLPDDVKRTCDQLVADGIVKNADEYCKEYYAAMK